MSSFFKMITSEAAIIATAHRIRKIPLTIMPEIFGPDVSPQYVLYDVMNDLNDIIPPYITKLKINIIVPIPALIYENKDFCLVSIVNASPKTDSENAIIAGTRARPTNEEKFSKPRAAAPVLPEIIEPTEAIAPIAPININRLKIISTALKPLLIMSTSLGSKFRLKSDEGAPYCGVLNCGAVC